MKILTAYFSLKGQTIAPGMKIVNLEKGHTATAAEFIQQAVAATSLKFRRSRRTSKTI